MKNKRKRKSTLLKVICFGILAIMCFTWIIVNRDLFKSYTDKFISIVDMNREQSISDIEAENYEMEIRKEIETSKSPIKLKKGYYALSIIKYLNTEYKGSIEDCLKALSYNGGNKDSTILDVRIYSLLTSNYIMLGNIEEGKTCFEIATEVALEKNKGYLLCDIYYETGKAIAKSGNSLDKAIEMLNMAVKYSANDSHMVRNHLFLATLYKLVENFDEAFKQTTLALEIAIDKDDDGLINDCIINIGENYYIQRDYPKSINVFEKLLELVKIESDKNKLTIYGYLAECYGRQRIYDEYNNYKDKYIEIANKINSERDLIWIYLVASEVELNTDINVAEAYLNSAKELYKTNSNDAYLNTKETIIFNEIKIDYNKDKNYNNAIRRYEDLLGSLYEKGVRNDISTVIINEILGISFNKGDKDVFLKYIDSANDFRITNSTGTKTDTLFLELNNKINRHKLNKLRFWGLILTTIVCINIYLLYNSYKKNKKIKELNEKLKDLNNIDPLTKLYNRAFLDATLKSCYEEGKEISYVMMDIDYFKQYNDHYGHVMGDSVLKDVAIIIKSVFNDDLVFRYGGEEFSVVSEEIGTPLRNKVRELQVALEKLNIEHSFSTVSDRVTLSIGIAERRVKTQEDIKDLCVLADTNLYISKESGRNRVT